MGNFGNGAVVAPDLGREKSRGCWTGWVADMQLIKSLRHRTTPETYMEHFPRQRAIALNTWLSRFGIYSNGIFLEFDRKGSAMAKEVIRNSSSSRGFWLRVDGVRRGDKVQVVSIREVAKESVFTDPDFARIAQSQLRGEFAKMGI